MSAIKKIPLEGIQLTKAAILAMSIQEVLEEEQKEEIPENPPEKLNQQTESKPYEEIKEPSQLIEINGQNEPTNNAGNRKITCRVLVGYCYCCSLISLTIALYLMVSPIFP